jgi:hypothetical protein
MIKFYADRRWYTWSGGLGEIFISEERGLTQGQTRVINNELFYVNSIYYNKLVSWTQIGCTVDSIRTLKKKFLGVE